MSVVPEAIEVLELEAAAIRATQPAAAAYFERLAHATGLLPAGVPLIAVTQHGRRRTGRPPFLHRTRGHDPRNCPDSVRLPRGSRRETGTRQIAAARRRRVELAQRRTRYCGDET